ncbi:hypothetical protein ZWY2020_024336 [Hordeum vulgare]|nr:hypothetical protein ZWY2020_024336 [Hordeum vulgare]
MPPPSPRLAAHRSGTSSASPPPTRRGIPALAAPSPRAGHSTLPPSAADRRLPRQPPPAHLGVNQHGVVQRREEEGVLILLVSTAVEAATRAAPPGEEVDGEARPWAARTSMGTQRASHPSS